MGNTKLPQTNRGNPRNASEPDGTPKFGQPALGSAIFWRIPPKFSIIFCAGNPFPNTQLGQGTCETTERRKTHRGTPRIATERDGTLTEDVRGRLRILTGVGGRINRPFHPICSHLGAPFALITPQTYIFRRPNRVGAGLKFALLVSDQRPAVRKSDALTAEIRAYLEPYGARFFLRALFPSCAEPIFLGPRFLFAATR